MAVNIPQLKQAQKKIMDVYGISAENAARVIGSYHTDEKKIMAILADDLSTVPAAAASVNVSLGDQDTKQDHKSVHPDKIRTAAPKKTKTGSAKKTRSAETITENTKLSDIKRIIKSDIPTIQGEIIPCDEIPPHFADTVAEWLEDFKQKYHFEDLSKIASLQWRAACLYIGQCMTASKVLYDLERLKTHGGSVIYNPYKVAAVIPIWETLTALYKHVPLTGDFIAFAGITSEWFYDTRGKLTSSRVDIAKKVREIEEKALAAALTDSRENPTGRIYYTKARLGWRETTEIIHTSAKETKAAAALPVFDGAGGFNSDQG